MRKKLFFGLVILFTSVAVTQAQIGYIAKLDLDWRITTSYFNPRFGRYAPVLVSDDWSVIGLDSAYSAATSSNRAVRWTRAGGTQDLGTFGSQGSGMGTMSKDGSVIFGGSNMPGSSVQTGFRWTAGSGMVPYTETWSYALYNTDRTTVVTTDRHAGAADIFARYDGSSLVRSGNVAGGFQVQANLLAGNWVTTFGQSINGSAAHAVRWDGVAGSPVQDIGTLGGLTAEVQYTNTDGTVAFGRSNKANGSSQAFRWTAAGGMQDVTSSAFAASSFAFMNASATSGFGTLEPSSGYRTFHWSDSGGYTDIGSLGSGNLTANKYALDGNSLVGITAATLFGNPIAVRWSKPTGLVNIGFTNMSAITYAGGSEDLTVLLYKTVSTSNQQKLYRVTGNNVLTDMGQLDGSVLSVYETSKDASKMLVTSASKMYFWDDVTGFHDMGIVNGVQIDKNSNQIVESPTFDLVAGSVKVGITNYAWVYSPQIGSRDLKSLLMTNGADLTNWDSLNQVDLIEDVNGVAYVTGLGTYNGVNGFKFYAAVPEPTSVLGVTAGILFLLRRRNSSKNPA